MIAKPIYRKAEEMFQSPESNTNANYTGIRDRLHPQLRIKTAHAFLEIVYMGSDVLMGADSHQGLFSEGTSKIMGGLDPLNKPDTLFQFTPDGVGPGSDAYATALELVNKLDPENDSPEEPKGW